VDLARTDAHDALLPPWQLIYACGHDVLVPEPRTLDEWQRLSTWLEQVWAAPCAACARCPRAAGGLRLGAARPEGAPPSCPPEGRAGTVARGLRQLRDALGTDAELCGGPGDCQAGVLLGVLQSVLSRVGSGARRRAEGGCYERATVRRWR
jgi:hypothetical protein